MERIGEKWVPENCQPIFRDCMAFSDIAAILKAKIEHEHCMQNGTHIVKQP